LKPKLIAIFLLLVLSPLVLLGWLGWRAKADEQARTQATVDQAYANQLASYSNQLVGLRSLIHETISEREREFSDLLDLGFVRRTAEIRQLVRSERFVRQVFIISSDGKFTHPPADERQRTNTEKEFFERTATIWESGEKFTNGTTESTPNFYANSAEWVFAENINSLQQQEDYSQTLIDNPSYQGQQMALTNSVSIQAQQRNPIPINFASNQGWYTWFHGDGAQIIYWRTMTDSGYTIGIEVDREALMAEVIAALPTVTGAGNDGIVLTDASARPIYQWGVLDPEEDAVPSVSIPLFAPLSMWHLNHYAPETAAAQIGSGNTLGLIAAITAAAVVLMALAVYFYRENSREMRTASEKVTFVNQVSHELKTPLTNIRMYAELAEEKIPEEDDNGARRCLDIVVNESQRLSRLIGNVLTFAKPTSQQPNPTSNVPDDLIRETIDHFRPALAAQDIEVKFSPGAGEAVKLDADILGQILGNLVSNVEKYAAEGKHVQITSSQTPDLTTITVTDKGPGVPRGQREAIFKPFCRLSNKLSDGVSGTGIGLTIARDLARKHGGDLTLTENRDASGCQFTLTLATST